MPDTDTRYTWNPYWSMYTERGNQVVERHFAEWVNRVRSGNWMPKEAVAQLQRMIDVLGKRPATAEIHDTEPRGLLCSRGAKVFSEVGFDPALLDYWSL